MKEIKINLIVDGAEVGTWALAGNSDNDGWIWIDETGREKPCNGEDLTDELLLAALA